MIDAVKPHLELLNDQLVSIRHDQIEIIEKKPSGAGTITFSDVGEAILLKAHDQPPIIWCLKNGKCAEGGFLTFSEDGAHLHIVEMKKTIKHGNWADVMDQFHGMFLSALAVCGIVKLNAVQSVTCYIAYVHDKMNPSQTPDLALIKGLVGKPNPYNGQREWETETLKLPHEIEAKIRKIQREEATGNAHYSLVAQPQSHP